MRLGKGRSKPKSEVWHIFQGPGCCGRVTFSWRFSTNIIIWLFVFDIVNLEAPRAMCVDENVLYLFVSRHWWILNKFILRMIFTWLDLRTKRVFVFQFLRIASMETKLFPKQGSNFISLLSSKTLYKLNWHPPCELQNSICIRPNLEYIN